MKSINDVIKISDHAAIVASQKIKMMDIRNNLIKACVTIDNTYGFAPMGEKRLYEIKDILNNAVKDIYKLCE